MAKGRGLRVRPALPFEAMLETRADRATWTVKGIEDVESARVKALLADGMSIRDIAEETGIARSTVRAAEEEARAGREIDPLGRQKASRIRRLTQVSHFSVPGSRKVGRRRAAAKARLS